MSEFVVVENYLAELRAGLDLAGLEPLDIPALLAAVRTIAHTVTHPAGPVATFAAGYAAARAGGSAVVVEQIIAETVALAQTFAAGQVGDDGD
ncbi:MAG: DUF6457 domain-containing protein [Propionibacteriaceae bacterium]|jgi:hypothetical protein|nr:DUF6457 domain-containing protein [Propionibacteriaceae bacterium]